MNKISLLLCGTCAPCEMSTSPKKQEVIEHLSDFFNPITVVAQAIRIQKVNAYLDAFLNKISVLEVSRKQVVVRCCGSNNPHWNSRIKSPSVGTYVAFKVIDSYRRDRSLVSSFPRVTPQIANECDHCDESLDSLLSDYHYITAQHRDWLEMIELRIILEESCEIDQINRQRTRRGRDKVTPFTFTLTPVNPAKFTLKDFVKDTLPSVPRVPRFKNSNAEVAYVTQCPEPSSDSCSEAEIIKNKKKIEKAFNIAMKNKKKISLPFFHTEQSDLLGTIYRTQGPGPTDHYTEDVIVAYFAEKLSNAGIVLRKQDTYMSNLVRVYETCRRANDLVTLDSFWSNSLASLVPSSPGLENFDTSEQDYRIILWLSNLDHVANDPEEVVIVPTPNSYHTQGPESWFSSGIGIPLNVHLPQHITDSVSNITVAIDKLVDGLPAADDVQKWKEEVVYELREAKDALTNVGSRLPSLEDLGKLRQDVSSDISDLSLEFFSNVPVVLVLCLLIAKYIHQPTKWNGSIMLTAFGIIYTLKRTHFLDGLLELLLPLVDRCKSSINDPSYHVQIDDTDVDLMSKVLFMCASWFTMRDLPTSKQLSTFVKLVGDSTRFMDGASLSISTVIGLFEKAVNYIKVTFFDSNPVVLLHHQNPKIELWVKNARGIIDDYHEGKLFMNTVNAERVFSVVNKADELLAAIRGLNEARVARNCINTYLVTLRRIQISFEQANITGNGVRMKPVTVLFRGATGTGKSTLTMPMIVDLLPRILPEEDVEPFDNNWRDYVHCRQSEHKFWDGYLGQFATVFDDFGQMKDVPGEPDNEFMDIIRCSNLFPNLLHMADLGKKDNTNFISKVLIASTNRQEMHPESIYCSEALLRRFDQVYDVCPKVEYCLPGFDGPNPWSRRLDKSKLTRGFERDMYEFHKVETKPGFTRMTEYTGVLEWKEVVSGLSSKYFTSLFDHNRYLSDIDDIKREAIASRYEDPVYTSQGPLPTMGSRTGKETKDFWDEQLALCPSLSSPLDDEDEEDEPIFIDYSFEELLTYFYKFRTSLYGPDMVAFDAILARWAKRTRSPLCRTFIVRYLCANRVGLNIILNIWLSQARSVADIIGLFRNLFMNPNCPAPAAVGWYIFRDTAEYKYRLDLIYASFMNSVAVITVNFTEFWEKYPWFKYTLSAIVLLSCVILPLYHLLTSNHVDKPKDVVASSPTGPGNQVERSVNLQASSEDHDVLNHLHTQGGLDVCSEQIATKVIYRNTYKLNTGGPKHRGVVVFLTNRIAVIPNHYKAWLENEVALGTLNRDSLVTLDKVKCDVKYQVPITCFLNAKQPECLASVDLMLCEFTNNVPIHSDITKYLFSDKELNSIENFYVRLYVPTADGVDRYSGEAKKIYNVKIMDGFGREITNARALMFSAPTRRGDCGAPLFICNSATRSTKLLGFHVGGSDAQGVAISAILSKDVCDSALLSFPLASMVTQSMDDYTQLEKPLFDGAFPVLFKLEVKPFQPDSTKLMKSVFFDSFGPSERKPAHLRSFSRDGVVYDPRRKSLIKYSHNQRYVNPVLIEACVQHYFAHMRNNSMYEAASFRRIFTFEEAVAGIPGVDFIDGIPRSTSPGFPWSLDPVPGKPGKTRFFGSGENYEFTSEDCQILKSQVEEIVDCAKKGLRLPHYYIDCLKDECLPNDKVDEGKARNISLSPLALLIATRMYTLGFSHWFMSNHVYNGSAVGINVYSEKWDFLRHSLIPEGRVCLPSDFSGYDASENPQVGIAVEEGIINAWYDGNSEDDLVRRVLLSDHHYSNHIFSNVAYQWVHGTPSGGALTTTINTLVHAVIIRMAFVICMGRDLAALNLFDRVMSHEAYGDDGLSTISACCADRINYQSLSLAFHELGYNFTDDTKGLGSVLPYKTFDESTFLKRSFRYEPLLCRFVAPLRLTTILQMLYWYRTDVDVKENQKKIVDDMLRELSLHGDATYDTYAPKLISLAREHLSYTPSQTKRRTIVHLTDGYVAKW